MNQLIQIYFEYLTGSFLKYTIDFGDGEKRVIDESRSARLTHPDVKHAYDVKGEYTIKIIVDSPLEVSMHERRLKLVAQRCTAPIVNLGLLFIFVYGI